MTGLRRFEQITAGGTPRAAELADPATAQAQPRRRLPRRAVHGVLLLDKPLGWTSNDLLQKVKNLLRAEKAGHTGTLDPLATGLLPLCFGAATKFSQVSLEAEVTGHGEDAVLREMAGNYRVMNRSNLYEMYLGQLPELVESDLFLNT